MFVWTVQATKGMLNAFGTKATNDAESGLPAATAKFTTQTPPVDAYFPHCNNDYFVFSAFGGIRTGSKLPVLTAYFPMLA